MQRLYKGFTLIEILVAMAILAVVTAIAIPSYNGYMRNSHLTECTKEIALIQLAQEEFFLENNAYFPLVPGTVSSDLLQISNIENASNNIYTSSYTVAGAGAAAIAATSANVLAANCTYSVTSNAGPGYTVTATGQNKLVAADTFTKTK